MPYKRAHHFLVDAEYRRHHAGLDVVQAHGFHAELLQVLVDRLPLFQHVLQQRAAVFHGHHAVRGMAAHHRPALVAAEQDQAHVEPDQINHGLRCLLIESRRVGGFFLQGEHPLQPGGECFQGRAVLRAGGNAVPPGGV